MSLKSLAQAVGLSEAYLSRLENHKAPITVDNLGRIAAALSVRIEEFFAQASSSRPLVITRSGKGHPARFRGRNGFAATLLAHGKRRKLMEPIILDVGGARKDMPVKSHSGQEFNYVLEGVCLFIYGGERYTLQTGDSAYFDAEVPHAVRPISGSPCRLLAVVGSDEFSMHGDLMTLLNDR